MVQEGYVMKPSFKTIPLLVAIQPKTKQIMLGIDRPDLIADLEESMR